MIDLHMHSSISDGSDHPLQLLNKVVEAGIKVFSITDHDTLESNEIILNEIGLSDSLTYITGTELSSVFEGKNLHLLCYGFDVGSTAMRNLVEKGARLRQERLRALFNHLHSVHGIETSQEERQKILSKRIAGKVHIAKLLVNKGIEGNYKDIFANYLNDMDSTPYKVSAEEVISATHDTGGIVCLAHPIEIQQEYNLDLIGLSGLCGKLRAVGLDGIEVYHSSHSKRDIVAYSWIALGKNFLVSGGSDYHGDNKSGVELGMLSNCGVPAEGITVVKHFFPDEE